MQDIIEFIQKTVKDANAKGVVIGISGGIDSAVVGELCIRALGDDKVYDLLMPSEYTPDEDEEDAHFLQDKWHCQHKKINLISTLEKIRDDVEVWYDNEKEFGNILARLRMMYLYFFANKLNCLVVGTTDKSENFIGYFTKYGDGGVDFEPIIHLTKTQIKELAKELGLPEKIINKKSSPRLWEGHEAEKELGITYEVIDKIIEMHEKTEHKRNIPRCIND